MQQELRLLLSYLDTSQVTVLATSHVLNSIPFIFAMFHQLVIFSVHYLEMEDVLLASL